MNETLAAGLIIGVYVVLVIGFIVFGLIMNPQPAHVVILKVIAFMFGALLIGAFRKEIIQTVRNPIDDVAASFGASKGPVVLHQHRLSQTVGIRDGFAQLAAFGGGAESKFALPTPPKTLAEYAEFNAKHSLLNPYYLTDDAAILKKLPFIVTTVKTGNMYVFDTGVLGRQIDFSQINNTIYLENVADVYSNNPAEFDAYDRRVKIAAPTPMYSPIGELSYTSSDMSNPNSYHRDQIQAEQFGGPCVNLEVAYNTYRMYCAVSKDTAQLAPYERLSMARYLAGEVTLFSYYLDLYQNVNFPYTALNVGTTILTTKQLNITPASTATASKETQVAPASTLPGAHESTSWFYKINAIGLARAFKQIRYLLLGLGKLTYKIKDTMVTFNYRKETISAPAFMLKWITPEQYAIILFMYNGYGVISVPHGSPQSTDWTSSINSNTVADLIAQVAPKDILECTFSPLGSVLIHLCNEGRLPAPSGDAASTPRWQLATTLPAHDRPLGATGFIVPIYLRELLNDSQQSKTPDLIIINQLFLKYSMIVPVHLACLSYLKAAAEKGKSVTLISTLSVANAALLATYKSSRFLVCAHKAAESTFSFHAFAGGPLVPQKYPLYFFVMSTNKDILDKRNNILNIINGGKKTI